MSSFICRHYGSEWWNRQTRTFEGRMPRGVGVQVSSPTPIEFIAVGIIPRLCLFGAMINSLAVRKQNEHWVNRPPHTGQNPIYYNSQY